MSRTQPTVSVIGSGLAAHVAAGAVADRGVEVAHYTGDGPGIFGIWNGLGSIFGPPSPLPSGSAGAVEQRASETRPFDPSRESRWRRLLERRGGFHPYRRLEFDLADIDDMVGAVLDYLPEGTVARTDPGTVLPGPHGQPAAPDVVFPSLASLDFGPGERVGLVRCAGLNGWDADAAAVQLDRATDLDARAFGTDLFDRAPPGHPVRVARWLEEQFAEHRDDIADAVGDLADRGNLDVVIVPPCIGRTVESHRDLWSSLCDATDAAVAEFPASTDPVFGWRLHQASRGRLADSPIRQMPAAESIEITDGTAIAVTDADGEERSCETVVLATGGWFGGGLPGEPPMVEPLTGSPLWIDGAPMPWDPDAYPPNFLGDRPWDDHDLFRAGLQIEETGRLLDRNGDPFDNVFAAGRVLAGFNPFHDDCTFGVDLATGLTAGRRAADTVGDTSTRRDELDSLETG